MKMIARVLSSVLVGWFAFMTAMGIRGYQRKQRLPAAPDPSADRIDLGVAFDRLDFRSTASAFSGGTIECWFGGGTIDLRDATLDPAGAELRVKLMFGGASLLVPDDWAVTSHVLGIGGVGDGRRSTVPADAPRLTIVGTVVFGGLGVVSRDPEREPMLAPAP
jgi:hypothetical protein